MCLVNVGRWIDPFVCRHSRLCQVNIESVSLKHLGKSMRDSLRVLVCTVAVVYVGYIIAFQLCVEQRLGGA